MILITQIIYIKPGQERVFDKFEAVAIPLIARYNGTLLFRVRPCAEAYIEGQGRPPYEIHLVSFPREADFVAYGEDPERVSFLYLKDASVDRIELIKEERK